MPKKNIFYDASLNRRHLKSKIFKYSSIFTLGISLLFLFIFLTDMIIKGSSAITQTYIQIDVTYNEKTVKRVRKAIDRKYKSLASRAWLRNIPRNTMS